MNRELARRGYGPVLGCRLMGALGSESRLSTALFTFVSEAACVVGMQIAVQWYWPVIDAPVGSDRRIADLRGRQYWYPMCQYYQAIDRDWRNGRLYAQENCMEIPPPPTGSPAKAPPAAYTGPPARPPPRSSAGRMPPAAYTGPPGSQPGSSTDHSTNAWGQYDASLLPGSGPPVKQLPEGVWTFTPKQPPAAPPAKTAKFKGPPAHLAETIAAEKAAEKAKAAWFCTVTLPPHLAKKAPPPAAQLMKPAPPPHKPAPGPHKAAPPRQVFP